KREIAVASLAPFRLTGDDDSGWLVQNSHGRFDFVHVLSAFAAAAESVDLEIGRIDFDRRGIGDLRNNIDTGKRSVPAFVRIEWRSEERRVGKECRGRWSTYN